MTEMHAENSHDQSDALSAEAPRSKEHDESRKLAERFPECLELAKEIAMSQINYAGTEHPSEEDLDKIFLDALKDAIVQTYSAETLQEL